MENGGRIATTDRLDVKSFCEIAQDFVRESDTNESVPVEVLDELKKSNLLNILIPSEYGGLGEDSLFLSDVIEELSVVNPSLGIVLFQHSSVVARIIEWGTSEQKEYWLKSIVQNNWIAASAWSEQNGGANKQNISTKAVLDDKGNWIVNGTKSFTTGSGIADLYLVLVQTSFDDLTGDYGNNGQTFFVLEADESCLTSSKSEGLIGMRGSSTGFVHINNMTVSDFSVLGDLGGASKIIKHIRKTGLSLGTVSVGIAQAAFNLARESVHVRGLTDNVRLLNTLCELDLRIETMRSLVMRAAKGINKNQSALSYYSKILASEEAEKVCRECQQIIGGRAFIRGNESERLCRDARAIALMGPVNDLARDILGNEIL